MPQITRFTKSVSGSMASWKYNNCKNTSTNPIYCFFDITSGQPPEPVYNTKVIALQDFSYLVDKRLVDTFNYFFDTYPSLFIKFPIVDTGPTTERTIELLNEYYAKGYRYFILTAHSYTILGVIDWFNINSDALGINPYAQSSALSEPKRIYCLTPLSDTKIKLYSNVAINPYQNIYFIYDSNQLVNTTTLATIQSICDEQGKNLVTFPISDYSTQLTTEYINNNILATIPTGQSSSIIVSMVTKTNDFYNLFNDTSPITGYNFYEVYILPTFNNSQSVNYFNGILYQQSTTQANLSSCYLWRKGLEDLGIVEYSTNALPAIELSQAMNNGFTLQDLGAYVDTLVFNEVTKISTNNSIVVNKFVVNGESYNFIPYVIYDVEPSGSVYEAYVSTVV